MITVKILTPYKVFLETDCDLVIVPGDDGELGILENHIDMVLKLEPGEVRFYQHEKVIDHCFVFGGLASFKNNELNVMADDVRHISELDLKYAESRLKFFSEEQKTVDADRFDYIYGQVLLYRRMLEIGQRR